MKMYSRFVLYFCAVCWVLLIVGAVLGLNNIQSVIDVLVSEWNMLYEALLGLIEGLMI